ncbi:MAG: alpha/beta hydrolase [Deltaproteobacteria bacterium]|nr:alpha/beta hydrolase [Deltaproteobacteria bacterium]
MVDAKNRIVIFCIAFFLVCGCGNGKHKHINKETVFLIHGMGRTSASMYLLKKRLEKAEYNVVSENYPSTKGSIRDHVLWLKRTIGECCQTKEVKTHFVTHSLGGIVLRMYLKENNQPNLGRVVMLSPPNKGSELADALKELKIYQMATGPSGQELSTGPQSTPNLLGPVNFDLGVITGDISFNPFSSLLIPGDDDGKVSVERAKIAGMKDFLVVSHSHTFIMNSPEVAKEIVAFLKSGFFIRSKKEK